MVGLTEITSALGGIKAATDMVKGLYSLKNEADINQAVINIQRTLLEAQSLAMQDRERQMELLSRIDELERKIADIENKNSDRNRYKLTEFPTGRFAYVLDEENGNGEPVHKLCVKCWEDGQKSVLQVKYKHSGGESVYCPRCKDSLLLSPFPEVKIERVRRSSWMDDY